MVSGGLEGIIHAKGGISGSSEEMVERGQGAFAAFVWQASSLQISFRLKPLSPLNASFAAGVNHGGQGVLRTA